MSFTMFNNFFSAPIFVSYTGDEDPLRYEDRFKFEIYAFVRTQNKIFETNGDTKQFFFFW